MRRRQVVADVVKQESVDTGALVLEKVSLRIREIEDLDKITPWNKAKLLAFREVRTMFMPEAETAPASEETSKEQDDTPIFEAVDGTESEPQEVAELEYELASE